MKAKKITALVLVAAMLAGTAAVPAFAEGMEIDAVEDDFFMETAVNDGWFENDDAEEPFLEEGSENDMAFADDACFDVDACAEIEAEADQDFGEDFPDGVEYGVEEGVEVDAEDFPEEYGDEEDPEDEILEDEDPMWLMLFADTNGVFRQVMIFIQGDGTWKDEQGRVYTENEDGTWTGADGTVYSVASDDGVEGFIDADFVETDIEDDDFVCLAASESSIKDTVVKETKKTTQATINGVLDLICRSNPNFIPLVAPLKVIIGELFGLNSSPDPNKVILNKLDEIDGHLTKMEDNLKEHCENVVSFSSIGGEFQILNRSIGPLKLKIGDIMYAFDTGEIDEEERNRQIAALYNSAEYNSVMQGLSGATGAYGGFTSLTLEPTSIFMAAYNLQCNSVMFSGEAVDCVTPYLFRQLCIYLKGYALINTVLDSYEAIHGSNRTFETRKDMFRNTGGIVNGTFDRKHPGVFALYEEFFKTYRYTFVNKSSSEYNHVKLNREIVAVLKGGETFLGADGSIGNDKMISYTPESISKCVLSAEQMKNLAAYASRMNTSVYNLLIDRVGFRIQPLGFITMYSVIGPEFLGKSVTGDTKIPRFGNITLTDYLRSSDVYMPTGPQYFTYKSESCFGRGSKAMKWNYMQAVEVSKKGAADEKVCVASNCSSTGNVHMLFFRKA